MKSALTQKAAEEDFVEVDGKTEQSNRIRQFIHGGCWTNFICGRIRNAKCCNFSKRQVNFIDSELYSGLCAIGQCNVRNGKSKLK